MSIKLMINIKISIENIAKSILHFKYFSWKVFDICILHTFPKNTCILNTF